METLPKLTPTQALLLRSATRRTDGRVIRPAATALVIQADGQPMAVTHAQVAVTKGRLRVLRRRSWRRF